MEKINWINGQAGGTPLSAENLNQMQDNIEVAIEELKPVVLYDNNAGSIGDINLNENLSYFKYLDIFLKKDDWEYSVRVYLPNGKTVIANTAQIYGTGNPIPYTYLKKMFLSGTTISIIYNKGCYGSTVFEDNTHYIKGVIGYK